MITQVCQYLRNWFEQTKYVGDFTIIDGELTFGDGGTLPLLFGQYYRVIGSVLNDGVHKHPYDNLSDESFHGSVWLMAVPPDFVGLVDDIDKWLEANSAAINSPYQSESFGGYSYSKDGARGTTWHTQFASRLEPWRKI